MDSPAKRLKWARVKAGHDEPTATARGFGWKVSTYLGHENGDRNPSRQAAKRYAKAYKVRWEWLLEGDGDPVIKPQPKSTALAVPLLSFVAAGKMSPQEAVISVEKHIDVAGLPAGGDWVALQVSGDSMDRVAPDGSLIVVDRNDQVLRPERFYVMSTEGGDATFKRFRSKPDRLQPFSTNPDHETQMIRAPIKVFGRVRRVIIDLK